MAAKRTEEWGEFIVSRRTFGPAFVEPTSPMTGAVARNASSSSFSRTSSSRGSMALVDLSFPKATAA